VLCVDVVPVIQLVVGGECLGVVELLERGVPPPRDCVAEEARIVASSSLSRALPSDLWLITAIVGLV
jgi:hypothetical protein